MSDNSSIEWTDASWTPIRACLKEKIGTKAKGAIGWYCEHVSDGCTVCYAERMNQRLGTGLPFKPGHRKDVELFLDENMLTLPLRWKKPRTIFVCSMTDLFADFVPDEWIDKMFAVMALSPQHTFQVLTKRAQRMRDYCVRTSRHTINGHAWSMLGTLSGSKIKHDGNWTVNWPLPNCWLGLSTERQQEADERIPLLLQTPAPVRFISAEPLLGPLDIGIPCALAPGERFLDWVIVGGESGPGARPMHPAWVQTLRDQCAAADVPFFFKQWGEWAPSTPEASEDNPRSGWMSLPGYPHVASAAELYPDAGAKFVARVGKKTAGRLLDGVEHNAMPGRT